MLTLLIFLEQRKTDYTVEVITIHLPQNKYQQGRPHFRYKMHRIMLYCSGHSKGNINNKSMVKGHLVDRGST